MNKRIALFIILILLITSSISYAFDGQRKGFVLGGGLGVSAISNWKVNVDFYDLELGEADESRSGVGMQFIIGGAFDEHNMLVYEGNVSIFKSDLLDEGIAQGFNGAAWYHYFNQPGKTIFSILGLGIYHFKVGDYEATNPGGALLIGGGYEFAKHWQVSLTLSVGKTTESAFGLDADFEHANLNIMISGIAY